VIPYQTKQPKLTGTSLSEVSSYAHRIFRDIESKTRRKPYIRSAYFKKEKVFLHFFWSHIQQKGPRDRFRRLKFTAAALDVIQYSKNAPSSKQNPNKRTEVLHRFAGLTKEGELFYVQVKENTRSKKKYFISCFPPD